MSGFIRNDHGNQWGGAGPEGERPNREQVAHENQRQRIDEAMRKVGRVRSQMRPWQGRKLARAIGRLEKEVDRLLKVFDALD